MLLSALLVSSNFAAFDTNPWIKTNGGSSLIDVTDGKGVALVTLRGQLNVYDDEGNLVREAVRSKGGDRPIGYSIDKGTLLLTDTVSRYEGGTQFGRPLAFNGFAQHGFTFLIRSRAHIFVNDSEFVSEPLGSQSDSLFGVNAKGTHIVEYRLLSVAPVVRVFTLMEGSWHSNPEPTIATVNSFSEFKGFPVCEAGLTDLRVFGDKFFVFLGRFSAAPGHVDTTAKLWPLKPSIMLSDNPSAQEGYLFATTFKTGDTRVIARLKMPVRRERFSPTVGVLSSSSDDKWLYLLGRNGIYRFSADSIQELLKQPE